MGRRDCPWSADGRHMPGCGCSNAGGTGNRRRRGGAKGNARDIKKHRHDWTIDKIRTHKDPVTGNIIRYKTYKCLNEGCPDGGTKEEVELIKKG